MQRPLYKLKTAARKENEAARYSTDHMSSSVKSNAVRNKLTKGCSNYEQLKGAYELRTEANLKTDYNECTFEPRVEHRKSNTRSFSKFIEDQENFRSEKENKIREFKTEMSRMERTECTNRPEIDKVSKRICTMMNYDKEDIVERLSKRKVLQQFNDDEELFSPKILPRSKSLKRSQKISEILHEDALRRQQKKQVYEAEKMITPEVPLSINSNTNQLVCNKMYEQFCQLSPQEEPQLPLVMVWTVISELFGVDLNPHKFGKEGKMCEQIAHILCKDENEVVDRSKLWEFIEIIVKKREAKPKSLAEELEQIVENFGVLYTCRVARPKSEREPEQFPFFPETLRSSQLKAQKHRQKLLQNAKQFLQTENLKVALKQEVTLEEMFMIQHMIRKASNEKKRIQKEEELMKQCTFKPQLSQNLAKPLFIAPKSTKFISSKKNLSKSISSNNISISHSFMSNTLKPQQVKPEQKPTQRILKQNKNKINSTHTEIKDMEKVVMRMAVARRDRQLSKQFTNRGYPEHISNWTQYAQREKSEVIDQHKKIKGFTYKKVTLK